MEFDGDYKLRSIIDRRRRHLPDRRTDGTLFDVVETRLPRISG